MLLLVDNFDSFTYNLLDYFEQLKVNVKVVRNNEEEHILLSKSYSGVILSPGPGNPKDAGKLMEIVNFYVKIKTPLLGICLGHQAIGMHFGAQLHNTIPMHGKVSQLILPSLNVSSNSEEERIDLFKNLKEPIEVVRYHSLILKKLPSELLTTSFSNKNEIMSFQHKTLPICAMQFHPEAWLSKDGIKMLQNWLCFNKLVN